MHRGGRAQGWRDGSDRSVLTPTVFRLRPGSSLPYGTIGRRRSLDLVERSSDSPVGALNSRQRDVGMLALKVLLLILAFPG